MVLALVGAGMSLTTCATLDEEECQTVDWRQLGQVDGAAGRSSGYVERHREACAKHGLPVSDQDWQAGWQTGIRLYCTPQNGLQVGREGKYYENSCPADLAYEFSAAYQIGKRVFDARRELNEARSRFDTVLAEMKDAKDEDRTRLTIEAETLRTQLFGAEIRVQAAEAAYDRYLYEMARGT